MSKYSETKIATVPTARTTGCAARTMAGICSAAIAVKTQRARISHGASDP